jgi:pimeloyl-ACP methyl ester carboxylesterase
MMNTVRSLDGTQIAFDRTGDGPPLVLVGGALSDRHAATNLVTSLASSFTVIAFDRRGRGDSGDTPPYAVEREVEDLDALLDEVGGAALVYGHSSGAVLALRAAEAGLAIPKLAVYEPPFIVDGGRDPLTADYVTHIEELVAAGRRGDAVVYFLTHGVGLPAPAVEQIRMSPGWPSMEAMAHTITYDNLVLGDAMGGSPDPLRRWATLQTPTLVIDGGASPAWIRNSARTLAQTLPKAEATTLEGQDHGAASEALAPVLAAFFSRVASPA